MQGVDVLSQELVEVVSGMNQTCMKIATIAIFIIFSGILCAIAEAKGVEFGNIFVNCIITMLIISFISLFSIPVGFAIGDTSKTKTHTEYKVTISDDVNFNEFDHKYEILSQEGKIYTIKERDDTQ